MNGLIYLLAAAHEPRPFSWGAIILVVVGLALLCKPLLKGVSFSGLLLVMLGGAMFLNAKGSTHVVHVHEEHPDPAQSVIEVKHDAPETPKSPPTAEIDLSQTVAPAWVDGQHGPRVKNGVLEEVVSTGYLSRKELRPALDRKLREALDAYIESEWGGVIGDNHVSLADYPLDRIVAEQFTKEEIRTVGDEPVHLFETHALVRFDDRIRADIGEQIRGSLQQQRLWSLGALSGVALTCLGAAAGYLRLDTLTRGYYSTRLKIAAAGLVAASLIVAHKLMA